jgi:putative transposase
MLVKKAHNKRSKEQKERILQDGQRLGVVAACRKHEISTSVYYYWLESYNSHGIDGLEAYAVRNQDAELSKLKKDLALAKEIIAEKELQIKLQEELLKKRIAQWNKEGKS